MIPENADTKEVTPSVAGVPGRDDMLRVLAEQQAALRRRWSADRR